MRPSVKDARWGRCWEEDPFGPRPRQAVFLTAGGAGRRRGALRSPLIRGSRFRLFLQASKLRCFFLLVGLLHQLTQFLIVLRGKRGASRLTRLSGPPQLVVGSR